MLYYEEFDDNNCYSNCRVSMGIRRDKTVANTVNIKDSEDLSIFSMIIKRYRDFCKKELSGYDFTPNEISTMVYLLENTD